jgi:hypothetical protein
MYDSITPYLPSRGIIYDYMKFVTGGEECPRFQFFAMVSALGSVIRRKVWFQRASEATFPTLFPSLWVILIAPQGIGKKSSTLRSARIFLDCLPQELKPKNLASKITPEALVRALSSPSQLQPEKDLSKPSFVKIFKKPAQGLLYSSEFGVLLGREKYNTGMIALLTDLYDCPKEWNSETIMHGDQMLFDVCLSIMGASTPDWMQSMLPTDAFKGGFMSRLVLVSYPDGWFQRVPDPPSPIPGLFEKVLKGIIRIGQRTGQMIWDDSARKFFNDWYLSLPEPEPGPRTQYLERKQDHMLRLAMILKLSYEEDLIIDVDCLEQAFNILSAIEKETLKMIDYISVEPRMRGVQRIIEILDAFKKISEAELLSRTWKHMTRPSEFEESMKMLLKAKKVSIEYKGADLWYILNKEDKNGM